MNWFAKWRLCFVAPATALIWFAGMGIYGCWWINNVLETEVLYGYERSRLLIASAFMFYRVPYLLLALLIVLILESLLLIRLSTWQRS
jgi:hypothetical protein